MANPWHNTNGQKFFNQFLTTAQSKPIHRQIPDQYQQRRRPLCPKQPQRSEESAFASFNSSPKTIHNTGSTSSSSGNSSNDNWRTDERSLKPERVFNKTKQEVQLKLSENQVSFVAKLKIIISIMCV